MNNETKKNIGQAPKFRQEEPAELDEAKLLSVAGGMPRETKWTYCGQGGPTDCYKPNPY